MSRSGLEIPVVTPPAEPETGAVATTTAENGEETMNLRKTVPALAVVPMTALFLLFGPAAEEAQAQTAFGVQGSWGSEADFGVGARLLVNLGGSNFEVAATADRFFPDNDVEWWDFNGNLFYHFHLPDTPAVLPYLGGGLNVARFTIDDQSSSEAGVNLGGGIRFPGNVTPFLEVRAVISDADQIVVTGGLLFGPTRFR
jgi:hypothetical protein